MEKFGETKKRIGDKEKEVNSKRKRSSGSETVTYLREKAEREISFRKDELEVKKREHELK